VAELDAGQSAGRLPDQADPAEGRLMGRSLGRPFRLFLAGQTVNGLGTMVSTVALPLVAVERLHASTFDVGLLEAVEWVPALVIGLHVGALVDRYQRRTRAVMMAANIGQAAAVAAVPGTAAAGLLTLPVLYTAAVTAGLFGVFFQTGYSPYLRQLVTPDDYVVGSARLQAGQAAARISGPALGGALVGAVGPATTLVADAVSFLVSFASLLAASPGRPDPAAPLAKPRQPLRHEVGEGLRYLRASPLLLTVAAATAGANLFLTAIGAVEIVFLVRTVGVTATTIGLLFAASGVGGLAGALISGKLTSKIGNERVARSALAVTAPAAVLIPLTHHGSVALFAVASFTVSFGIALASVALLSLRLRHTPAELQGRISSSSRMLTSATIPVGALAGGALGQLIGTRPALYAMAATFIIFSFALLRSPLKTPSSTPVVARYALIGPGKRSGAT
jgi:MFS family permease